MLTEINIFDCDGVLLSSAHRYKTMIRGDGMEVINLQHWIDNEHLAYDDSPLPTAFKEYSDSLNNPNAYTVMATAAIVCENRIRCLNDKIGLPDYIIGRKNRKDTRGGAELKIAGLRQLLALKQFNIARNNMTMVEDNLSYLTKICKAFNCRGLYIPSVQGH